MSIFNVESTVSLLVSCNERIRLWLIDFLILYRIAGRVLKRVKIQKAKSTGNLSLLTIILQCLGISHMSFRYSSYYNQMDFMFLRTSRCV